MVDGGESLSYRWLVTVDPASLEGQRDIDAALFIVMDRPTSPDFQFHPSDPTPSSSPVSVLARSASLRSSSTASDRQLLRRRRKPGVAGCVGRRVAEACRWVAMKLVSSRREVLRRCRGAGGGRKRREVFPVAMDYFCKPKRGAVDAGVECCIRDAVLHCKQSIGKA